MEFAESLKRLMEQFLYDVELGPKWQNPEKELSGKSRPSVSLKERSGFGLS